MLLRFDMRVTKYGMFFLYLINVFHFVVFTKSNFVDLAFGKIMFLLIIFLQTINW